MIIRNVHLRGKSLQMTKKINGVRIQTPARLHLSLIDLNGELGRIDGGIGVAIAKPNWIINISKHPTWKTPPGITEHLKKLQQSMQLTQNYKITIESELPEHVGLGSQTQLALALGHGLSILEGLNHTTYELASLVARGGTSGIGIAAYERGGFILDGGHSKKIKPDFLPSHFSNVKPAVLVNRLEVPKDWYFVVAIPDIGMGKYGTEEVKIFNKYCPIPSTDVEKLSRIILMQVLPSIIESDIEQFGSGLNKIQSIGFKRIENKLQNEFITQLQEFFLAQGATGTGLSSFGPATFSVIQSEAAARSLMKSAKKYLKQHGYAGTVFYTQANNKGAEVTTF